MREPMGDDVVERERELPDAVGAGLEQELRARRSAARR
jgi:hypothetical protein